MPMKYQTVKFPVFILFLIFSFFIFCSSIALSFPQTKNTLKHGLTTISSSDTNNAKTVRGVVIDIKSKQPLKDVIVMIVDTAKVIRAMQESDSSGVFIITGIKQDRFKVRTYRYGYVKTITGPYNLTTHDTLSMLIKIEAVPFTLKEVVVIAKRRDINLDMVNFYRRKKMGMGHYVTWNDFKDRVLSSIYDIFRGIPGVIVGDKTIFLARYAASSIGATKPQPLIYVDGMLLSNGVDNIGWLSPESVQAVEVYNAINAPMQYSMGRSAGVILIWTKN